MTNSKGYLQMYFELVLVRQNHLGGAAYIYQIPSGRRGASPPWQPEVWGFQTKPGALIHSLFIQPLEGDYPVCPLQPK